MVTESPMVGFSALVDLVSSALLVRSRI
jgi:hypothetical protein